ncbi:MAG: hypothetical protein JNL54_08755 [Kineosporiaceae bacterium]|nr:hypothetical protein [Kineosporiaceae bacterium]
MTSPSLTARVRAEDPSADHGQPALECRRPDGVHLFDGPYVSVHGERRDVPEGSKKLLAFVCLAGGHVERRRAAGTLWPEGDDVRAAGNLRSALWRLKGCGIDVIESDKVQLWVRAGTGVDVERLTTWADRMITHRPVAEDLDPDRWPGRRLELLPGWYDDWAIFERERMRQILLHALEALACELVRRGRAAEAVDVALTAVAAEPLRESAHRVLIETHLAEGNVGEARQAYRTYRDLALRELGVEPSRQLALLVDARPPIARAGVGGAR